MKPIQMRALRDYFLETVQKTADSLIKAGDLYEEPKKKGFDRQQSFKEHMAEQGSTAKSDMPAESDNSADELERNKIGDLDFDNYADEYRRKTAMHAKMEELGEYEDEGARGRRRRRRKKGKK